jgi:Zn-dependent protease
MLLALHSRGLPLSEFWLEAARLNLLLNVANLAPIPRLDGGHLTALYTRTQKALVGFALLLLTWTPSGILSGLIGAGLLVHALLAPRPEPGGGTSAPQGCPADPSMWTVAAAHVLLVAVSAAFARFGVF